MLEYSRQFALAVAAIAAGWLLSQGTQSKPAPIVAEPVSVSEGERDLVAAISAGKKKCGKLCKCLPPCGCERGGECLQDEPGEPPLRPLSTAEFLDVIQSNFSAWKDWVEARNLPDELSMRELVEAWLVENPQHDPRISKPKPPKQAAVSEPLFTQPQPAPPKAKPAEYVQVRQAYRYGVLGRRVGYRYVTVTLKDYQATQQPRPGMTTTYKYYGSGCAGGRCGR